MIRKLLAASAIVLGLAAGSAALAEDATSSDGSTVPAPKPKPKHKPLLPLFQTPPKPAPGSLPYDNPADWRVPDPQNTLVFDTTRGRIIVEMRPELAPNHVERLKLLARRGFFDGLNFHRVIDWFMAQGGDPLGNGDGQSIYPNLKAEFMFRRGPEMPIVTATDAQGLKTGFIGSLPVATQPDDLMSRTKDGKVWTWGLYCPGVAGMARDDGPDTANSQFFFMRQANPPLDKRYTVWGRVIVGLDVVRGLKAGEPPTDPDKTLRVRVLADLQGPERPVVEILSEKSVAFRLMINSLRTAKGADFSICDVEIPARVR